MNKIFDMGKKYFFSHPDVHDTACNLKEVSNTLELDEPSLLKKTKSTYHHLEYAFDQTYLDKNLNINSENPNSAFKKCNLNPELFLHLTCDEGIVLVSFINNIKPEIKNSDNQQITVLDLKNFSEKIKNILNKTEEKIPEFIFFQTMMNYKISKIKDPISLKNFITTLSANLALFVLIFNSRYELPEFLSGIPELTSAALILQILMSGSEYFLKMHEFYKENIFRIIKNRMEKKHFKGELNENPLFNIIIVVYNNLNSIIEKIEKYTNTNTININNLCLNHLETCYQDDCVDRSKSGEVFRKIDSDSIKKFTDFKKVIIEHLISLEILIKEVSDKIYDKIINYFNIDKLPESFELNKDLLKSVIDKNILDIYENRKEKYILLDAEDDTFFDLIDDSNKKYLYDSFDVLLNIILNIILTFRKPILNVTKDNLKTKIKNTIHLNIIKSALTNIKLTTKNQNRNINEIKDIIKKNLGKDILDNLVGNSKQVNGLFFKKYEIPFYNIVILYCLIDHINFKFPVYQLYKFNV